MATSDNKHTIANGNSNNPIIYSITGIDYYAVWCIRNLITSNNQIISKTLKAVFQVFPNLKILITVTSKRTRIPNISNVRHIGTYHYSILVLSYLFYYQTHIYIRMRYVLYILDSFISLIMWNTFKIYTYFTKWILDNIKVSIIPVNTRWMDSNEVHQDSN